MADWRVRLLVATTNAGKIREIRQILDGLALQFVTLADLPPIAEPEETGGTFAENAELKARYYAGASGLGTVAEDSGLAIDAIGGRPGVASARYPGATYADKFANLYRELAPHARPWTARFVCSLCYVGMEQAVGHGPKTDHVLFTTEASIEGEIAQAPRGANGFGYDPIFYFPPYAATLGEVDDARKLAVAHRGKAFRTFRAWLHTNDAGASA